MNSQRFHKNLFKCNEKMLRKLKRTPKVINRIATTLTDVARKRLQLVNENKTRHRFQLNMVNEN